jgi:acetoin utilization deacetylase AcuC-like enzyme
LELLRAASEKGKRFGASTVLPPGGWLAISLAAGAALDAADAVLSGATHLAFCLVRPPGHHAARASNDGYCHVNNAAVAANRAAAAGHRVAILDFDVHHGNGTQSIFYDRNDVLCVSLHMNHGAWDEGLPHPETGSASEVGVGAGVGFNVNVPLDFGVGDSGYMRAFDALVAPEVDAFKPTFIVIACGVDGSQMDPNGRQLLTTKGFFDLGRACRKLADKHASSRAVITLEGGYHVSYAAFCVHAVLAVRRCARCAAGATHRSRVCRASRACRILESRIRCRGHTLTRRCTTPPTLAWTRSSAA